MKRRKQQATRISKRRCAKAELWAALPTDLQDVIAGYLGQKDKTAMSMVCKAWNAVLRRGRLRLNLPAGQKGMQKTFSRWATKEPLILNELAITYKGTSSREALTRNISGCILPSVTSLTSLHISQSKNVHMSVLRALVNLKILEVVNCQLQMGRCSKTESFPLLGHNTKIRKLALTSSTINLHKTPTVIWNLPNLEFLKLDGLHAVNWGVLKGQVHIHCATTDRLLGVQCLRRLNLDWLCTTRAPAFSFGRGSFKGVTSLAASCGAMSVEFLNYPLRELCLENFTPTVVPHGFPTSVTSLELDIGKLGRDESTTQAVLLPLHHSCKQGLQLQRLTVKDPRGNMAYPFYEMIDYNSYFKPMAAFQGLSCLTSLRKLVISAKSVAAEPQGGVARLQLPQLKKLRLTADAEELDLHLCTSLTELFWTEPTYSFTRNSTRRLVLPEDQPPNLTSKLLQMTPMTCSIITDNVVALTKPGLHADQVRRMPKPDVEQQTEDQKLCITPIKGGAEDTPSTAWTCINSEVWTRKIPCS